IVCALPVEYNAICLLFDQFWDENGDEYGRATGDHNQYTTGCIGKQDIVVALLPYMGKAQAARAATNLRTSYNALELVLLVGICGVVPHVAGRDILLGDVVISKSVVQYGLGRQYPDTFVRKDTADTNLNQPTRDIRSLLLLLETDRGMDLLEGQTAGYLQELQAKAAKSRRLPKDRYRYPGSDRDRLFEPAYRHRHRTAMSCICRDCGSDSEPVCEEAMRLTCETLGCETSHLVRRAGIEEMRNLETQGGPSGQNPSLVVGSVASGDTVMKSAAHRDRIAAGEDVVAFEMEGAGLWEEVPCVIVKGACDYADCHKSKEWQPFAAATAAAAAKAVLNRFTATDRRDTSPVQAGPGHGSVDCLERSLVEDGRWISRNHVQSIDGDGSARIRVGNDWEKDAFVGGGSENRAGSIKAGGRSVVHIGNRYGGQGQS
ncbi:uncharacterized protein J7T54_004162, partial [Emericellopsis cladophorae]